MRPVVFEGGMFTSDPSFIEQFTPTEAVATCYIVCNGKILLLKRNPSVTAAGRWSMPGGKLEQNETALEAVIREVEEETAILLPSVAMAFIQTIAIRLFTAKTKEDYWLHLFKTTLPGSQPSDYPVILNQEHTDYLWANLATAQRLNLLAGGRQVLDYIYHVKGID